MDKRRTLLEQARYVESQCKRWDLDARRIKRACRLAKVITDRPDPKGTVQHTDRRFKHVVQSMRDLADYAFIFDMLQYELRLAPVQATMNRSLQDRDLPEESTQDTAGRDAQAEMLAMAMLKRAGLRPVRGECLGLRVDFLCNLGRTPLAVEVKRVKSIAGFGDAIKKAIEQVRSTGCVGHIMCDISAMTNDKNQPIVTERPEEWVMGRVSSLHKRLIDDHQEDFQRWRGASPIYSLDLINHMFRFNTEKSWGSQYIYFHAPLVVRDSSGRHWQNRIARALRFCLPGIE